MVPGHSSRSHVLASRGHLRCPRVYIILKRMNEGHLGAERATRKRNMYGTGRLRQHTQIHVGVSQVSLHVPKVACMSACMPPGDYLQRSASSMEKKLPCTCMRTLEADRISSQNRHGKESIDRVPTHPMSCVTSWYRAEMA